MEKYRLSLIMLLAGGCLALGAGADVRHPVYGPTLSEADCQKVAQTYSALLALSEDQLQALVPDQAGFYLCGCPNCEGGAAETQLEWNIYAPHQVRCKFCGMIYPNEKYPERYKVEVRTPDGRTQIYPYFQDAKGRQYFFQARAWFERRRYLAGAAYDLAALYHNKPNPALARRVALILAQFASVYPGYAVRYEDYFTPKRFFPSDARPPFPVSQGRAAKWSWWFYLDIPNNLILAYDLIYPSGELEKLDAAYGRSVKEMIERDFFRASVEFVRARPEYLHNMSPHIYQGLIIAGRVLGEPGWVHDGIARAKTLMETKFYADGVWYEGASSYHCQTVDLLSLVFKAVKGYSDPPSYKPETGPKPFENLSPESEFPFYGTAVEAAEQWVLPDGHFCPVNDTWAWSQTLPPLQSRPILFPWFGYGVLGHGEGEDQFQAHVNWSSGYGHQHLDKLGILLFAKGRQMISDIGYTHTRLRGWATSTASHNTVMIDGKDQCFGSESKPNGGDLLLFEARNENVQLIEAEAPKAYPGLASEYRRALIVVRVPPRDAYVVDVFSVVGGRQHDWLLHGSADEDVNVDCTLPLSNWNASLLADGVKFSPPANECDNSWVDKSLGFITNLRRAATDQTWSVEFTSRKGKKAGLRGTVLGAPGTEVFLGQAPSVRRAREDESLLEKYRMPVVVVRRRAAEGAPLSSVFIAVHEPFSEAPFISKIEPLDLGNGNLCVAITHSGGTDYIMLGADRASALSSNVHGHALRFRGRFGLVRTVAAGLRWTYMVDAEELQWDNHRATSPGRCEGAITGVYAASPKVPAFFETASPIPDSPSLKGSVMIVRHGDGSTHGFTVKEIVPVGKQTWIFPSDDPGFTYDSERGLMQLTHFPHRSISGPNSFIIPYTAFSRGLN